MKCNNCNSNIADDAVFCPVCGKKIEKEAESNVKKVEVKKDEKKKRKNYVDVIHNKYFHYTSNIIILILAVFGVIVPFVDLTDSNSLYGSTNIITLLSKVKDTYGLTLEHANVNYIFAIIGLIFVIATMIISIILIIGTLVSLITNKDFKLNDILSRTNFGLYLIINIVFGFSGVSVILLTVTYFVFYIIYYFLNIVSNDERIVFKIIKGIAGFIFFVAYLSFFCTSLRNLVSYSYYTNVNNGTLSFITLIYYAFITGSGNGYVLVGPTVIYTILCFTMTFIFVFSLNAKEGKMTYIFHYANSLLMIVLIILMNVFKGYYNINDPVQLFIAPLILTFIAGTFLVVIDLVNSKKILKVEEKEEN